MVSKGRYQTEKGNGAIVEIWYVVDTQLEEFVCSTTGEKMASFIATALNFNNKPSDYGYKLVD